MRYRWIERHGAGWRAWITIDGVRRRGPTRATKKEAYEDALRMRAEKEIMVKGGAPTLGFGIDQVLKACKRKGARAGTLRFYKVQFALLRKFWVDEMLLSDLDPQELRDFIDRRLEQVSPNTVNHHIRAIGRIFNVVRHSGHPELVNPVDAVERPRNVKPKRESFEWDDAVKIIQSVRDAGGETDADLFEFTLRTGLRLSEIARIQISDVDLDAGLIHVRDEAGKTGSGTVSLTDRLEPVVQRMVNASQNRHLVRGDREDLRVGRIERRFKLWKKRLGLDVWRPHALRHTLGHALGEAGANLPVIGDALRHAPGSAAVTRSYVKGKSKALNRALERLDGEYAP